MANKPGEKLFVLRTYVKARNAAEAMRRAKKMPPDEAYISEDWKEGKNKELAAAIGFEVGGGGEEGA